ncbi:MAG: cupin-like domain-containing protein [Candidatus Binatia bacterium]
MRSLFERRSFLSNRAAASRRRAGRVPDERPRGTLAIAKSLRHGRQPRQGDSVQPCGEPSERMRSHPDMRHVPLPIRAQYNVGFLLEHALPTSERVQRIKAAARGRIAEHVRRAGRGRVIPIARTAALTASAFRRHFLSTGTPVLVEGAAASWPLMERWSFEELDRRFGHETIKLVQRAGGAAAEDLVEGREFSEEMGFGAFLRHVNEGGRKYMRFAPLFEQIPELLDDFDHSFFREVVRSRWGMSFQLFIGGGGTNTPLHNEMMPFFYLNVRGTKRWALVSNHYLAVLNPSADGLGYNYSTADLDFSDADAFPGIDCIDRIEVEMQPGDLPRRRGCGTASRTTRRRSGCAAASWPRGRC